MELPTAPDRAPAENQPLPEPSTVNLAADIERFWTDGSAAYPAQPAASEPRHSHRSHLKLPGDACCAGVDVPSVGLVHSYDCQRSEREPLGSDLSYAAGEFPPTLKRAIDGEGLSAADPAIIRCAQRKQDDRDRLLIRLLFAARALAMAQIEPATTREVAFCTECVEEGRSGAILHGSNCRAGRVLSILGELQELNMAPGSVPDATGDSREGVPR